MRVVGHKTQNLADYEEIIGTFGGLESSEAYIQVIIANRQILIPNEGGNTEILRNIEKGTRIAILRLSGVYHIRQCGNKGA